MTKLDSGRGAHSMHRWFDSGTGRYERPDPLLKIPRRAAWRSASAPNPYFYAKADPLKYVDPLGLVEIAPAEPTRDCNFSRYRDCCGLPSIARWCCKRVTDFGCGGNKNILCCEAEFQRCVSCSDQTDPDYHLRAARCEIYKSLCIVGRQKADCPSE